VDGRWCAMDGKRQTGCEWFLTQMLTVRVAIR